MTNDSNDDYNVGYKKPPSNTQFKKGKSGNPKGRPKGPTKKLNNMMDFVDLFLAESERPVVITENGEQNEVMMIQVALRQVIAKAAKGNISAIKFVSNLMDDSMRRKVMQERQNLKSKSKKTADGLIEMMTEDDMYRTAKTMYETVRKPSLNENVENKDLSYDNLTEEQIAEAYINRVKGDYSNE